jgi:hypothetical protein
MKLDFFNCPAINHARTLGVVYIRIFSSCNINVEFSIHTNKLKITLN